MKTFLYFRSKLAFVIGFFILFCGNTFAMKSGFWQTDVAVICDDYCYDKTKEIIKLMCENECVTDGWQKSKFLDIPIDSRDSHELKAIINCYSSLLVSYRLYVNFKIYKSSELTTKSQEIKGFIKNCAQTILFYDLDDPCSDEELIEKLDQKVDFLLSFHWNNCVQVANHYINRKIIKHDDRLKCRVEKVKSYTNLIEQTGNKVYRDPLYQVKNNRWGSCPFGHALAFGYVYYYGI